MKMRKEKQREKRRLCEIPDHIRQTGQNPGAHGTICVYERTGLRDRKSAEQGKGNLFCGNVFKQRWDSDTLSGGMPSDDSDNPGRPQAYRAASREEIRGGEDKRAESGFFWQGGEDGHCLLYTSKGYDHNHLKEGRHPSAGLLDRVFPDNPVVLQHQSGHMGVFNSRGLERLGDVYTRQGGL